MGNGALVAQAIAQAVALDKSGSRGPLTGVPFGIKDIIDTSDMPTEYGSPIYKGHQPRNEAACVALGRKAGLLTKIGEDHFFPNVQAAVDWAQHQ